MATQLHNRFSDEQIKELLRMYLKGKITKKYLQDFLKIKNSRFFVLIKKFKTNPNTFSFKHVIKIKTHKISNSIKKNIIKELSKDKKLILNKDISVKKYNKNVSLPTIINRVKTYRFYIPKKIY